MVSVRPRLDEPGPDGVPERVALVLFIEDEVESPDELTAEAEIRRTQAEGDQMIPQLRTEIRRLREQLQFTVEEHESSNEEMKAANEELQSINEEYRSATEELETSKEELQSVNEELQTVNSEMRNKLDEVSRAHKELENLMGATEIATLFLDRDMRIQRFSAGIHELFSMLQIDRGRRVSDLSHNLGYNDFVEDAEKTLHKLQPVEREIQTPEGRWFLIRLRPYRTVDDKIEGVVITFIDINELKAAEREIIKARDTLEQRVEERTREVERANQQLSRARDLFFSLFNANPIPTALISLEDNSFLNVNNEFLNYFGFQHQDVIHHNAAEFNLSLELDTSNRLEWLAEVKEEGRIRTFETTIVHPSGETRTLLASIQYLELNEAGALIATFIDISDRVRAEQQIRSLAAELTATEQAERHRLAQILHDDLQQRIFAIQMHLSFLKDAYGKNDLHAFEMDFPQVEEWLAEALQVTRHLSVDLSPPILHGEGLEEATIWLASQMQEQYNLNVKIQADGPHPVLEENTRVLVFYAIRELLFNVVKHSGVLEATVAFEDHDHHLKVIVSDAGHGFASQEVMTSRKFGYGLLSLRHRLNLLGCELEVRSEPGDGTQIIIEVPYERPEESS
jgi:two-component system CheB/CheR fusion protein